MHYSYNTKGTCAKKIEFDIEENRVKNVAFLGGCDGNLKAIARLVEGEEVACVIDRLSGLTCGWKKSSCGDQLATALKIAIEGQ